MNTTGETYETECCMDCAMLIANGDTSGNSRCETEEGEAAYLEEVNRRSGGIFWVLDYRPVDPENPDSEESPDAGFSWSACGVCGSSLGGDRFYVAGWLR